MKPFNLEISKNKGKKYTVYVPKKDKLIKVSYGAAGMSDYTIHKNKKRRDLYRARHINDNINDPYSPGFWAWHHLWGESSDFNDAFYDAVNVAIPLLLLS